MNYWLVIHDRSALLEEPNRIGKTMRLKGKISKIKKGDKVLYYLRGESVIVNSYDVVSVGSVYKNDDPTRKTWRGEFWAYKIKKRLNRAEVGAPMREICEEVNLDLFPHRSFQGYTLMQRTAIKISKRDFQKIERYLKSYKPKETELFKGPANEGDLGQPMDLEILNYAPTSEQGVVVLFSAFMKRLPYGFVKMEFVRSGFPDACVLQKNGTHFSRKYIEFEFKASSFRTHEKNTNHRNTRCDYVVCWENDYPNCPVKVIDLKTELRKVISDSSLKQAA